MTQGAAVLAFDMGASSGRALVGRLTEGDTGKSSLEVTEIHRFPNHAIQVGKHLHWDTLRLLHEMKKSIRFAFQKGFEPATFGIDTWGVDFGLLDANGELLGSPYHYRDPQTEGLIEEVSGLIGQRALFEQSGLQFMPFNTLYQLYAMVKAASPKLEVAKTLLLTPDLLAYLLTGVKSCEFTMATTTQLFDPARQAWNTELMERLGIPSHLFLEPVQPGTIVGPLSPEVQEELGVPAIRAVAVGTHDTESAIAAVPAGDEPFAFLVCGTWSLLGTEMDGPLLSPETMELEFSNEGGVGGTYQLLKNIMGLWLLQECKREWDEQGKELGFPELVRLAEQAAPFRSLIHPDDPRFFSPDRQPPGSARVDAGRPGAAVHGAGTRQRAPVSSADHRGQTRAGGWRPRNGQRLLDVQNGAGVHARDTIRSGSVVYRRPQDDRSQRGRAARKTTRRRRIVHVRLE